MRTYFDIPYVDNGTKMQLLDIYLPDQDSFGTIIWFHGGSIEKGSRKEIHFEENFVNAGYGCVSVEYRMYPDAKFPEFIEDAAASVAYVLKHIGTYGGSQRVYVGGTSAGAYLTMMLCMDHRYLANVGVEQEQIAGYISDSAQQFCHFNVLRELGYDTRLERIDEHAPIYFIRESLTIRPLLLLYYEDDMKCRPEETRLMYASLQNVMPEAEVYIKALPGGHCKRPLNEDGVFMVVAETLKFIERVKR